MTEQAATPHVGTPPTPAGLRDTARDITGYYWWFGLVAGIAWLAIALVVLQFDQASVTTVGILIGLMFTLAGVQNLVLASVQGSARWVWALFGVLFLVSAVICFIDPKGTFAAIADILGFLFLLVAIWWMVRAFLERPVNPYWWLGLISGILMTAVAFWTAGQFWVTKAYILLVFAGIWALAEGIVSIVRAFAVRRVHEAL